jgi:hypothetical protein
VNCRTHGVAALPEAVGDAEAATLPVAGLAALHAFRQCCCSGASFWSTAPRAVSDISPVSLLWRPARKSGAMCDVRNTALPSPNGAAKGSFQGRELTAAKRHRPFRLILILDSLGGSALAVALGCCNQAARA